MSDHVTISQFAACLLPVILVLWLVTAYLFLDELKNVLFGVPTAQRAVFPAACSPYQLTMAEQAAARFVRRQYFLQRKILREQRYHLAQGVV